MTPLVSVIVPTHNASALLGRALTSVAAQTFARYEVIVSDDGSTDDTSEVVNALASRFSGRLQYLAAERNGGAAAARNRGVLAARGEYIAFLDADDEWLPAKLEAQVRAFATASPEVALVTTQYRIADAAGGAGAEHPRQPRTGDLSAAMVEAVERRQEIVGVFSTLMFRRTILDRVGWLDESLPCWHDTDFYLRAAEHAHFGFVPETLVVKHEQPNSISYTRSIQAVGSLRFWHKHRTRFSGRPLFRRFIARHQHELGIQACRTGDLEEGRRLFRASLGLAAAWRPATHLALSLAAPRAYMRLAHGPERRRSTFA
jgi:glycosyltransferase involved in cell wall biosynthesis